MKKKLNKFIIKYKYIENGVEYIYDTAIETTEIEIEIIKKIFLQKALKFCKRNYIILDIKKSYI